MKQLLNFLHGTWLKHPLHPILVTFPLGLWTFALLFDVLSLCELDGEAMARLSLVAIIGGLAGALLAAPTGLADWSDVGRDKPAWKIGLYHMILNVVAVVVWAANLAVRLWITPAVSRLSLALSVLGTILVFVSAYLGGRMVYDQGTYVGWTTIGKYRQAAEAAGARVPHEK